MTRILILLRASSWWDRKAYNKTLSQIQALPEVE